MCQTQIQYCIHLVRGKEAIKLFKKEIKENKRRIKLMRLIIEVRKLRRQLREQIQ